MGGGARARGAAVLRVGPSDSSLAHGSKITPGVRVTLPAPRGTVGDSAAVFQQ
jgi:hypothetical protein